MTAHTVQADKPINIIQCVRANYFCPVTYIYLYTLFSHRVQLAVDVSWTFRMLMGSPSTMCYNIQISHFSNIRRPLSNLGTPQNFSLGFIPLLSDSSDDISNLRGKGANSTWKITVVGLKTCKSSQFRQNTQKNLTDSSLYHKWKYFLWLLSAFPFVEQNRFNSNN